MAQKEFRDMILNGEFDQLPKPKTWMSLLTDLFFWNQTDIGQQQRQYENEGLSVTVGDRRYTYPSDSPIPNRYLRPGEFNLTHTHLESISVSSHRINGELYYVMPTQTRPMADTPSSTGNHIYTLQDICDSDPVKWLKTYGLKGLKFPAGFNFQILQED
jgi:hypothetical protein